MTAWGGSAQRSGVSSPGAAPGGRTAPPTRRLAAYLVEDNARLRENLIGALEELAPVHVVGTAADESVAAQWLRAEGDPVDLVIVDIFLRSGSGLGVVATARRRRPGATIVVLSNYATDEMRVRSLALGADRVFDKSCDIDALVAFCESLAARGTSGAPH